jgi:hypothetical protein
MKSIQVIIDYLCYKSIIKSNCVLSNFFPPAWGPDIYLTVSEGTKNKMFDNIS